MVQKQNKNRLKQGHQANMERGQQQLPLSLHLLQKLQQLSNTSGEFNNECKTCFGMEVPAIDTVWASLFIEGEMG